MTTLLRSARLRGPDVELSFGDNRPDLTLSLLWLRDHDSSDDAPATGHITFAEDRAGVGNQKQPADLQANKTYHQVGSQYTLPPRSTAVGVISLSAVIGGPHPLSIVAS